MTIHTPAFDLAVGERRDVAVAILYARGADNLDSITRLRAASDAVQARFDSGTLGASTPLPRVVSAPVPAASDPRPTSRPPTLTWAPAGAGRRYRVETSLTTPFSASATLRTYVTTASTFELPASFLGSVSASDTTSVFWRVRVDDLLGGEVSAPSATRRFVVNRGATAAETPVGPVGALALSAPVPNPSRGTTVLAYDVPSASPVRLDVLDVLGRRVATLVDGEVPIGRHETHFDSRTLAPGVYVVRLAAGEHAVSRLITVAR